MNNVGLSYDHAEYLDAIDDQLVDDLIQINIQATNKVSQAKPRRRCKSVGRLILLLVCLTVGMGIPVHGKTLVGAALDRLICHA